MRHVSPFFANRAIHVSYCLLLLVSLTSCSTNNVADLEQYVHNKRAQPPGKIPPLPRVQKFKTYAYDDSTLRNPFVLSNRGTPRPVEGCPLITRARTLLEQTPLDSLSMVGTLSQNHERWVLIKDSEHNVHSVKKGHYLGQNGGKIINITESEVVIQELVSDRLQGCISRQTILAISG